MSSSSSSSSGIGRRLRHITAGGRARQPSVPSALPEDAVDESRPAARVGDHVAERAIASFMRRTQGEVQEEQFLHHSPTLAPTEEQSDLEDEDEVLEHQKLPRPFHPDVVDMARESRPSSIALDSEDEDRLPASMSGSQLARSRRSSTTSFTAPQDRERSDSPSGPNGSAVDSDGVAVPHEYPIPPATSGAPTVPGVSIGEASDPGVPNGLSSAPAYSDLSRILVEKQKERDVERAQREQERLEWQTMFQSALHSEVLRSETKRIISVDSPEQTKTETMYQRWIEIRTYLRGDQARPLAAAMIREHQLLHRGWPKLLEGLIDLVLTFTVTRRADGTDAVQRTPHPATSPAADTDAPPSLEEDGTSPWADLTPEQREEKEQDAAFHEVGALLERVDNVEQQFPSLRKMVEVAPRWGTPQIQDKLAGLYSWYNCFHLIRVQLQVLRKWTGSDTLEIHAPPTTQTTVPEAPAGEAGAQPHLHPSDTQVPPYYHDAGAAQPTSTLPPGTTSHAQRPGHGSGAGDEGLFIERLMKDKLLTAFEKRTLRYHTAILNKARDAIKAHHSAYEAMHLPSFQAQLVQLANFPVALMEGVLRMRLSYELTLRQQPPSLMIIDSFILDLRSALALACYIKDGYIGFTNPDKEHGWDLPNTHEMRNDSSFDLILREALVLFFNLLDRKLKVSAFFKETEILQPEWSFLSTAASSIKGGDIIVANRITRVVTQLFTRIEQYFRSELGVPILRSEAQRRKRQAPGLRTQDLSTASAAPGMEESAAGAMHARTMRRPTTFGGLTKGHFVMNLRETETWIRTVVENVRIRSRRLLAFSRDIRGRLDNAAEYDLRSLQLSSAETSTHDAPPSAGSDPSPPSASAAASTQPSTLPGKMTLDEFLQVLMGAGFFLVHSHYLSDRGIYVLAMPSLHDQPELVLDLLTKCLRPFDTTSTPTEPGRIGKNGIAQYPGLDAHFNAWGEDAMQQLEEFRRKQRNWDPEGLDRDKNKKDRNDQDDKPKPGPSSRRGTAGAEAEAEQPEGSSSAPRAWTESEGAAVASPCRYVLLLSLRQDFFWTGDVMPLHIPEVDISMLANRLRLVADGSASELQRCKDHLYGIFAARQQSQQSPKGGTPASLVVPPAPTGLRRSSAMTRPGSDPQPEDQPAHQPNMNRAAFPLETVAEYMAHIHSVQKEVNKINMGIYKLAVAIITEVPKQRKRLRFQNYGPEPDEDGVVRPRKREPGQKGGDVDELIQFCYQTASEHALRSLPFIVSAKVRAEMTVATGHLSIDWISFITDDCVPTDRRTFKWAVSALEHASFSTRGDNILKLEEGEYALLKTKVGVCIRLLISHFDILGARSSAEAKMRETQQKVELDQMERKKVEAAEGLDVRAQVRAGNIHPHQPSKATVAAILINSEEPSMVMQRRTTALDELERIRGEYLTEVELRGRVLDDSKVADRGLQALAQSSHPFHWKLGQVVGSGTFGTVYSALDLDTGHMMAVKEIRFQDIASHPTFFEQIKDEMTVMQLLNNINIVRYYGIEVHRDKVYIFEEYCEGGSLAHMLEMGPINDETVMQFYTLQMLDGLSYLHNMGIVHRDIKPENILMDPSGVIKYVDFGAAKILANNPRTVLKSRRTKTRSLRNMDGKKADMHSLQGTPMYMSPESINPELMRGMDKGKMYAMDIWSVGCVVLECVTGERPWKLDNEWAIMYHIGLAKEHPPLPDPSQLSPEGIDFIAKCLTIDPNDRPTADQLREHPWMLRFIEENEREVAMDEMEANPYMSPYTPSASDYSEGSSPYPYAPTTPGLTLGANSAGTGSSYLSRHGSGSSDSPVPDNPPPSTPGLSSLGRQPIPSLRTRSTSLPSFSVQPTASPHDPTRSLGPSMAQSPLSPRFSGPASASSSGAQSSTVPVTDLNLAADPLPPFNPEREA